MKRLISDKEIQENPGFFPGELCLELGPAWLGLEKIGIGLERIMVIQSGADKNGRAGLRLGGAAVDATPAFVISVARCASGGEDEDAAHSCGGRVHATGTGWPFEKCGIGGDALFLQLINSCADGEPVEDLDDARRAASVDRRLDRVSQEARRRSQPRERSGVRQQ